MSSLQNYPFILLKCKACKNPINERGSCELEVRCSMAPWPVGRKEENPLRYDETKTPLSDKGGVLGEFGDWKFKWDFKIPLFRRIIIKVIQIIISFNDWVICPFLCKALKILPKILWDTLIIPILQRRKLSLGKTILIPLLQQHFLQ